MVAVHRTAQRGADGHEEQRILRRKHADHDGQDQRDGSPRRAHGEADERRHHEDDHRQQSQPHADAVQEAADELARAKQVAARAA